MIVFQWFFGERADAGEYHTRGRDVPRNRSASPRLIQSEAEPNQSEKPPGEGPVRAQSGEGVRARRLAVVEDDRPP